jgi:predicted transcriptional regulator
MIPEDTKGKIARRREGPVQLAIMAALTKHNGLTVDYLARFHFRGEPTADHIRSVKYALKRLIESGMVQESRYRAKSGQKQYSLTVSAQKRRARKAGGLTVVK